MMRDNIFTKTIREASMDPAMALLEGVHAVKHAVRFEAQVLTLWSPDKKKLEALVRSVAPDIVPVLENVCEVSSGAFEKATVIPVQSYVLGIARRPSYTIGDIASRQGRVVLLDRPTHLGNVGACIRVAAARGSAGVCVTGTIDPWHPHVIRGAAGLQFALPVVSCTTEAMQTLARPIVAFDEGGDVLGSVPIPTQAVLAFGGERRGLSDKMRHTATHTVRIPMQHGVASLNLATSVAIALYHS